MNEVKKTRNTEEIIVPLVTELFFILLPAFILLGIPMGKQDIPPTNHGILFELLLSTMLFYANILRMVATPFWAFASRDSRPLKWIATPVSVLGLVFTGVLLASDPQHSSSLLWVIILCGIGLTLWASVSWCMIDRQKKFERWLRYERSSETPHNKSRGVPEEDKDTPTEKSGRKQSD